MGGILVQFGDGAQVVKVNLPSDFSAVRISKLPAESTPNSVSDMMRGIGFVVPPECVQVHTDPATALCLAKIRVEDAGFANRLCSKLASEEAAVVQQMPNIEAVPLGSPLPVGASSARVDCKKVHCSWHRPVRLAWLNFSTRSAAQKVNSRFDSGSYKVLYQKVEASVEKTTMNKGMVARRNTMPWTVVLKGVPGCAGRSEIVRSIPPDLRPRHVELGEPTFNEEMGMMNATVKSMLTYVGRLDFWEDAPEIGSKRAKVTARFQFDEDAREAVANLNNKPLPFSKTSRLTMQLVYSSRMKEPDRIYQAVKGQIEKQRPVWKAEHVTFIPYPANKGYRVLKLEGEDIGKVAQAKKSLEQLLRGSEALDENGKPFWSSSFANNGEMCLRIKDIQRALAMLIIRDRRRCRLRLYGSDEQCQKATEQLAKLVEEASSVTTRVVELDQGQFVWACRGGYRAIASALAESTVAFDVISTPKRILVSGTEGDYALALEMAKNQAEHATTIKTCVEGKQDEGGDCIICFDKAEEPMTTNCGHTYCGDCFERLCNSSSGKNSFVVACEGDMGNCKTAIPLPELQEHLSSASFDDILSASFTSYVRRHPETFRYCPTPDCDQVYRVTTDLRSSAITSPAGDKEDKKGAHLFVCSMCLASVCTSCHVLHPGISCAEHSDISTGGYKALAETKARLGVKDCPKCTTPLEKIDGCDHMTCLGCGTHICWKCLCTFKTDTGCYDHMRAKHGNIGLEHIGFDDDFE